MKVTNTVFYNLSISDWLADFIGRLYFLDSSSSNSFVIASTISNNMKTLCSSQQKGYLIWDSEYLKKQACSYEASHLCFTWNQICAGNNWKLYICDDY